MKFLDFLIKFKTVLDMFKKSEPSASASSKETGKTKRIVMAVALILTGILLAAGIVILVKRLKQRRMQKEAEEALEEFYSTDPDADEYDYDDEE